MNKLSTTRASRHLVTGILALAILASGAGGYVVGRSDASTRADTAPSTAYLADFRASEHQGSAESPSLLTSSAPANIRFLASEHQGSAESPSATIRGQCADSVCITN